MTMISPFNPDGTAPFGAPPKSTMTIAVWRQPDRW